MKFVKFKLTQFLIDKYKIKGNLVLYVYLKGMKEANKFLFMKFKNNLTMLRFAFLIYSKCISIV